VASQASKSRSLVLVQVRWVLQQAPSRALESLGCFLVGSAHLLPMLATDGIKVTIHLLTSRTTSMSFN
jgi:hypothetical protein